MAGQQLRAAEGSAHYTLGTSPSSAEGFHFPPRGQPATGFGGKGCGHDPLLKWTFSVPGQPDMCGREALQDTATRARPERLFRVCGPLPREASAQSIQSTCQGASPSVSGHSFCGLPQHSCPGVEGCVDPDTSLNYAPSGCISEGVVLGPVGCGDPDCGWHSWHLWSRWSLASALPPCSVSHRSSPCGTSGQGDPGSTSAGADL